MTSESKWALTVTEKEKYIAILTNNLAALRTQAGISQEDLANLIGISRQTYSAVEHKSRKMAWSTYLSLVLFFDYNHKTHKMIRMLSIFPKDLVTRFNDGPNYSSFEMRAILDEHSQEILESLDQQALQSIRSVIMVEYARCSQLPSEAIIKSFGGLSLSQATSVARDAEVAKTIKAIKRASESDTE